jgi:hypothetical protein
VDGVIAAEHHSVALLVRQLAARWDAGLFLCGSRLIGSSGADHDYRLVVDDLRRAFDDTAFLSARTGIAFPCDVPYSTAVGVKFAHGDEVVSLQVLSKECIQNLASLNSFAFRIARNTSTYPSNVTHGFHDEFSTEQRHDFVTPGTWCVTIDQSPWQHGVFATQIYHNMLIASRIICDVHDLAVHRFALIESVRQLARTEGLTDVEGVGRLLRHTTRRLPADVLDTFIHCLLDVP